jgi:AAA+ ATPase superfamily predicted ATPase
MFANRAQEFQVLKERFRSRAAELIILYGRRRVGKTELIRTFLKGKRHLYYLADRRTEAEQLEIVSSLLGEYFRDEIVITQPLQTWDVVFRYIETRVKKKERLVLVLDEFPYLVETTPALPSILQRHWDQHLKRMNIFIVLCGSSMSFMEKEILSYKSPLYGRRTGQLELLPFGYRGAHEMFPQLPAKELIEFYAVFGGIPAYLECIDPKESLWKNVERQIFPSDRFLHNEVNFLLMEELRTPRNYFAILRALAFGRTRINDIVQMTGLDRGVVGKYLDNLMELRIVERKVPVTEHPTRSRKGIYRMQDHYFRFWFRYIYPHLTYLEEGRYDMVLGKIREDFSSFVGAAFEEVCREFLRGYREKMPVQWTSLGSWWDKDDEIDIVAGDEEGNFLLGECKWSNKKVGTNVYLGLKEKSRFRAGQARAFFYVLFSKSGFTDEMRKLAEVENVRLVDLDQLL